MKKRAEPKPPPPSSIRFSTGMAAAIKAAQEQIAKERPELKVGHAAAVRILVAEALVSRKIQINNP